VDEAASNAQPGASSTIPNAFTESSRPIEAGRQTIRTKPTEPPAVVRGSPPRQRAHASPDRTARSVPSIVPSCRTGGSRGTGDDAGMGAKYVAMTRPVSGAEPSQTADRERLRWNPSAEDRVRDDRRDDAEGHEGYERPDCRPAEQWSLPERAVAVASSRAEAAAGSRVRVTEGWAYRSSEGPLAWREAAGRRGGYDRPQGTIR